MEIVAIQSLTHVGKQIQELYYVMALAVLQHLQTLRVTEIVVIQILIVVGRQIQEQYNVTVHAVQ